jgi:hypothetical protein
MTSASTEIRWFQHEPLSLDVLSWFIAGIAPIGDEAVRRLDPEERTDRYVLLPGVEATGVKVRAYGWQRYLEVKALRGAGEIVTLPGGVSGRLEHWQKWAYGGEAAQPLVRAILAEHDGYVDIEKARWQRQFKVEDGTPIEVALEPTLEHGCYAELVSVKVDVPGAADPGEWWSLAFEARGEPEQARPTLLAVAAHFLTAHPPRHPFTALNSASYPTWLAAVGR